MEKQRFFERFRSVEEFALAKLNHGHWPRWNETIKFIESLELDAQIFDGDAIEFRCEKSFDNVALTQAMQQFSPWRKGPFSIVGDDQSNQLIIDSEWRSNYKWNRLSPALSWEGARVLDVGGGNGYYAMRAMLAGAQAVVNLDPTQMFLAQFNALRALTRPALLDSIRFIPTTLETFDVYVDGGDFDRVMSMGVLYHRREPLHHLRELRRQCDGGATVIIETLIHDGDGVLVPDNGQYAGMPNVHTLPNMDTLLEWIDSVGFSAARCIDANYTTIDEQRVTKWSGRYSLADRLNAGGTTTIEGLPAPLRVIVMARA